MSFLPHTPDDRRAMLQALGLASADELFDSIPAELRLGRSLELPPALGELELTAHLEGLAGRNASVADRPCFLGGGPTTTSSPRPWMPWPVAANSSPPTRRIRPRPARGRSRRSSSIRA